MMEKMSVIMKRALTALMLAVCLFSLAGEAAAKPDWGTVKYTGASLQNPGQVYKYEHSVPLGSLIKPYNGSWKQTNEATQRGFGFKFNNWSLDSQVQSHK
ncbi:MAG: hypothetical protein LBI74_10335 [Synergistaceae bacterium]|nr:hypothetical protein [Synergistaceae bacterium]